LSDEVEAKAADIVNGFQDDAVEGSYTSIKDYFTSGKKDKGFDKEVDRLIDGVYKLYSSQNTPDWAAKNGKNTVDKKTVFKYLEHLTTKGEKQSSKN
jgi:hypothetical protein